MSFDYTSRERDVRVVGLPFFDRPVVSRYPKRIESPVFMCVNKGKHTKRETSDIRMISSYEERERHERENTRENKGEVFSQGLDIL